MSAAKLFFFSITSSFLIILLLFSGNATYGGSDFLSYYTGALLIKNGQGKNLYTIDVQKSYQQKIVQLQRIKLLPFKSLPFAAALFLPFAYFPYLQSYMIFAILNFILLLFFIRLAQKVFIQLKNTVVLGLLTFGYLPNIHTLLIGQTSLILSLVFLFIYITLKYKNSFLVGLLCGLILFKVQYLILLPFLFFLVHDKRSYIAGVLVSMSFLVLFSVYLVGWHEFARYPAFVLKTEQPEYGNVYWHPFTLYAMIRSIPFFSLIGNFYLLCINTLFYISTLVFFAIKSRGKNLEIPFVFAICMTILFSIHALAHDLAILMTPILILLNEACSLAGRQRTTTLFLATILYSLMFFLITPGILQIHFNFAPLVLLGIGLYLMKTNFIVSSK